MYNILAEDIVRNYSYKLKAIEEALSSGINSIEYSWSLLKHHKQALGTGNLNFSQRQDIDAEYSFVIRHNPKERDKVNLV